MTAMAGMLIVARVGGMGGMGVMSAVTANTSVVAMTAVTHVVHGEERSRIKRGQIERFRKCLPVGIRHIMRELLRHIHIAFLQIHLQAP